MTALVGDSIKSKILEKCTKFIKHSLGRPHAQEQRRYTPSNSYVGTTATDAARNTKETTVAHSRTTGQRAN